MSRNGFSVTEQQRDHRAEPQKPHPGRHRRHRPAPVERDDGNQVDQVQEEADVGERPKQVAVRGLGDRQADRGAERPEDRPRQSDARLGERVLAERLRGHDRAEERE